MRSCSRKDFSPKVSEIMNKLLNLIYVFYVWITFSIWVPIMALVHLGAKLIRDEHRRLRFIYRAHRVWIGSWELLTRINIQVLQADKIHPEQVYIFTANHNNLLDIPVVGSSIIHPWKSLVKREILSYPLVGWLIRNISIPVDRASKESRHQSLLTMIHHLQSGISVLVFPEGTRNRSQDPLKRFHPGAFRAAIAAQVPVMPIVLTGIREMQPVDTLAFYPGTLTMRFLDPIPTQGLVEADEPRLREKVYAIMEREILASDPYFNPLAGQLASA